MGSAGAKVISVVRDVTDAYVHAGGQYEWDSAAPVAVARAAGLFTSRVDGSPLRYNQDDVYLPDLVVCRPELAETDPGPPRRRTGCGDGSVRPAMTDDGSDGPHGDLEVEGPRPVVDVRPGRAGPSPPTSGRNVRTPARAR